MENHEKEADFKKIIDHFTGVTAALIHSIRCLQAQPGYQHPLFQNQLAAIQVSGEMRARADMPLFNKAYQETLEHFGAPIRNAKPSTPE